MDIWLDSQKNGWDTYRYTDSGGNPVGNGDDAWVDHDNRVYFRITNGGMGDASNVRVRVYANEPPGMGDSGADWRFIGSAIFSSIVAGASEVGYVTWKPVIGEHTCLKVVIVESDLETTPLDNIAQENVTAFDTRDGSPYRAQCRRFTVNNPFEFRETPVHMLMRDIPDNWIVQVEPTDFTLAPASSDQVCVLVFPPEPDEVNAPGFIGKLKLEAQVPFANTFIPIGGIDIWTHLTHETRLSCDSTDTNRLDNNPSANPDTMGSGLAPKTPTVDPSLPPLDAKALEKLFCETSLIRPEPTAAKVGVGEIIQAEGQLDPGFSGATIAVDFISGEERETRLVTTSPAGKWSASFDPDSDGLWEVKAYYAGDNIHAAAESNRCRYEVERRVDENEVCDCDPRDTRWAHWLAIAAGILALVLFYVAYLKRICWLALIAAITMFLIALIGLVFCLQTHLPYSIVLLVVALFMFMWYRVCLRKPATRG